MSAKLHSKDIEYKQHSRTFSSSIQEAEKRRLGPFGVPGETPGPSAVSLFSSPVDPHL